jgi:hypothetical protein
VCVSLFARFVVVNRGTDMDSRLLYYEDYNRSRSEVRFSLLFLLIVFKKEIDGKAAFFVVLITTLTFQKK